jgi:hypothetical protein
MAQREFFENSGSSTESLEYYKKNKNNLGKLIEVRCDKSTGEKLRIRGEEAEMKLSGCTCGYSGQGPQTTAEVLHDLEFEKDEAWELAQALFTIFYQFPVVVKKEAVKD